MKVKKKENILIIALLILMILAIIGVSYAAFSFSKIGTKVNSITTGSITMSYEESDNTITLSGALPTTDETGKKRLNTGEYFDFTVSSKIVGDVNINYEISAKDVTASSKKIDGSNIKLYLTRLTDNGEEELMSPNTYTENTSENSYTGRPSGEMSLYQGSMSSSETNKYRLRMWVDEEYNPQGDGGSLAFSVKVNVYGKAGDKMSVKDQILAANPLQEEKEKMFNYTSNGYYVVSETSYGLQTEKDPNYVTKGLYSMEDEDGISYYFRGDIDNNNVQFGEYESDYYVYSPDNYSYFQSLESCQQYSSSCSESNRVKLASKGDKMYWKIVRINGDGSLRLIYNGTDSFVKREVDIWYQNTLGSSSYDSSVIEGRFCSDSSGYKKASEYGFINEYRSKDMYYSSTGKRLGGRLKTTKTDNNPTLICPETSETYGGSYRLKAGLITADELVLAGENYLLVGESYYLHGYMDDFWTMTPAMFITSPAIAGVWVHNEYDDTGYAASGLSSLRPVINVKADNFTSGFGTSSNPYVIEV